MNEERLRAIARLLGQSTGSAVERLRLAARLDAEAPPWSEYAMIARETLSANVAPWQFNILRDQERLAAFEGALQRIAPGKRVLDLGSGSGLLGMMAARAGAVRVFGCESDQAMAFASERVVQANGFGKGMTILAKHSDDLDIEEDLEGGVDVIVFDIGGGRGVGDGVLPSIEGARRLLRPGGKIIPGKISLRVALGFAEGAVMRRIEEVRGFDLSGFNGLVRPEYVGRRGGLELRSEAQEIFGFDFTSSWTAPERHECVVKALAGEANVIVQWVRLDLDGESNYENVPGTGRSYARSVHVVPLEETFSLRENQEVRIAGSHDRHRLRLWLSEAPKLSE